MRAIVGGLYVIAGAILISTDLAISTFDKDHFQNHLAALVGLCAALFGVSLTVKVKPWR